MIFSYPGLAVPSALLRQISAGQAAGVIFFGETVSSEAQIASVNRQLRQAPSWAVYPALDARRPAGLSSAVIQGELRGRLGFRGVTITDAIEAGALASSGRYGQRAVLAAQAGMDLLLCSARDVSQGQAVVTALAGALDGGKLGAAGFNAAVRRVTALRNGLR